MELMKQKKKIKERQQSSEVVVPIVESLRLSLS